VDQIFRIGLATRRMIVGAVLFNARVAESVGLSASDGQFLNLLSLYGTLTPGRLAQLSGFSTGAITGVVDRLERKGWVHRVRDGTDRRSVRVALDEEKVAATLAPLYAGQAARMGAVLASYDQRQLDVIEDFLTRLGDTEP
jgi:DNA-binding MarR family transcriptional regulator